MRPATTIVYRVHETNDGVWGDVWVWDHWEEWPTAHQVLLDQSYAKEVSEQDAFAILDVLSRRPKRSR
ncbi:hypothetical protein AKJ09_10975 [Labilithrix luteola]|uniref:Uncharacterized protein n=1 Tax=Labilithrix luteola TaxID=1391654 RepID=A0A0K1QF88_9BACT|nr:hypothetical protein [Labilithrix luteola]AKV04312.1 hypothetical protein AKJ09_10975 [Labilithrix luteola]